jgi:hypothetical protein
LRVLVLVLERVLVLLVLSHLLLPRPHLVPDPV